MNWLLHSLWFLIIFMVFGDVLIRFKMWTAIPFTSLRYGMFLDLHKSRINDSINWDSFLEFESGPLEDLVKVVASRLRKKVPRYVRKNRIRTLNLEEILVRLVNMIVLFDIFIENWIDPEPENGTIGPEPGFSVLTKQIWPQLAANNRDWPW